jgi:hypothetical protein
VNRRALVIVSLVAITILGGIAAALALVNDDDPDQIGAEPAPATGPDFDGVTFTDPQGAYRLDVDPTWETDPEPSGADVESWRVGQGAASDRVDVTTSEVGDIDLDQYLQFVIERLPDDFELREFRVVSVDESPATDAPPQLGIVAYEAMRDGAPVAYLLVASVEHGTAVVATLTSRPERFDDARAAVEPYLMTLRRPTPQASGSANGFDATVGSEKGSASRGISTVSSSTPTSAAMPS